MADWKQPCCASAGTLCSTGQPAGPGIASPSCAPLSARMPLLLRPLPAATPAADGSVKEDIHVWWPFVRHGGIFMGGEAGGSGG